MFFFDRETEVQGPDLDDLIYGEEWVISQR